MRLPGVDVARAVALLGMVATHVWPEHDGAGGTTLAHLLASGRASALFAVLAGVGLALLTGGDRPRVRPDVRASVVLRALLVGVLGLLLALLPSGVAVILANYGLLFLVAVPLLGLRARVLGGLAAGLAVVGPLACFMLRPHLPRLGASPTFGQPVGDLLASLLVTGYYPVLAWSAYLVAGLAVGRLGLGRLRVQQALLGGGALLAVAAHGLSALLLGPLGGRAAIEAASPGADLAGNQFGDVPTTTPWWLAVDAPHSTTPLDLAGTTGSALAVLGLCLLLTRSDVARRLLRPLAAAGAMPLTLYAVHLLVLAATVGSLPLLLWGAQAFWFPAFALVWLTAFRRGPLEQLVATASRR